MRLRYDIGHLSKFKVIGNKIGLNLSFGETLNVPISHLDCLLPEGVS